MTSVSTGEGEERREKREGEYEYTHMSIRIRKSKYPKLQLYVPLAKRPLIEDVKGLLRREGSSLSEFMIDKFEEYYRLHAPGNPQQRLDTIMKLGKAYHAPKPICGVRDCFRDVIGVGIYLPTGKEYGLCKPHFDEARELGQKVWRLLT